LHAGTIWREVDTVPQLISSQVFARGRHQDCTEDPSDEGTFSMKKDNYTKMKTIQMNAVNLPKLK